MEVARQRTGLVQVGWHHLLRQGLVPWKSPWVQQRRVLWHRSHPRRRGLQQHRQQGPPRQQRLQGLERSQHLRQRALHRSAYRQRVLQRHPLDQWEESRAPLGMEGNPRRGQRKERREGPVLRWADVLKERSSGLSLQKETMGTNVWGSPTPSTIGVKVEKAKEKERKTKGSSLEKEKEGRRGNRRASWRKKEKTKRRRTIRSRRNPVLLEGGTGEKRKIENLRCSLERLQWPPRLEGGFSSDGTCGGSPHLSLHKEAGGRPHHSPHWGRCSAEELNALTYRQMWDCKAL